MQMKEVSLTPADYVRYSRQLALPGFGLDGQVKLKNSRVSIAGAGGLGCPIALYLAAAGVGFISIIDGDVIELSNIHRQIAYKTVDTSKPKAQSLVDIIYSINPDGRYEFHNTCLDEDSALTLLKDHDLIIDGTDNFLSKFLIADSCHRLQIPLLYGAVHQYAAQVILLTHSHGPCLRCLYNEPPSGQSFATCEEAGILGVVAGTVGMLMASEAVKYLSGMDCRAKNNLLRYDAIEQSIELIALQKDPQCPQCGLSAQSSTLSHGHKSCAMNEFNSDNAYDDSISIVEAKQMIAQGAFVLDVREPSEYEQSRLTNAVLIPMARLPAELASSVPRDKPVVVYCQHGVRSLAAVNYMRAMGYAKSYSIAGGMAAWSMIE